jgi:histidinol-phosphatase (PHP family)
MTPLLYETHMHTPLCGHAVGGVGEYAAAAEQRGLAGIVVTCHNPCPAGFAPHVRMRTDQFDAYRDMVAAAADEWAGRVDVRLGLECDWFPGHRGWLEKQLASAEFHYVLGSVHPHLKEFKQRYWRDDPAGFAAAYFDQLAEAAETRLFDCISHPDLVKNITPSRWSPDAAMDDVCRALDRIAATGVSMELNTSGANKAVPEMNPFPAMLAEMRQRSIPVVLGADAHEPGRVGDRFEEALLLLADVGYERVGFYLNRQRREIGIDEALASLRAAEGVEARE